MAKKRKVSNNWYSQRYLFISLVERWYLISNMINPFEDLESNNSKIVEEFKSRLKEQFDATKDPWILNGVYDYYLSYNSARAIDVIVTVKEPHDTFFFDRSYEGIRSNNKLPHLTLLGYVIRRRPIWLYRISSHVLLQELLRLLKSETDIVTVVSALLIINILLPIIPGLLGPHLQEIFAAFSKLAAVNANTNNYHEAQLVHLQISLYTLFHRLYGMFPCNFVSYLRKAYSTTTTETSLLVFSHTVKPMLDTVRVNPLLISATEDWEISPTRWKNVEPHDIIISCAKLLMNGGTSTETNTSTFELKPSFNFKNILGGLKVTGNQSVADYCNELGKKSSDAALWSSPSARYFNSVDRIESTPTTIPLTPITRGFEVSSPYSEHEGSSPPEAAVEATPETTPIRDYKEVNRPVLRSIVNRSLDSVSKDNLLYCSKVPIPNRSVPSSPVKKEAPSEIIQSIHNHAASPLSKVNKLINDRQQVASGESDIIRLKPVGAIKNDLNSNTHHISHTTISCDCMLPLQHPPAANSVSYNNVNMKTNGATLRLNEEEFKISNHYYGFPENVPELNSHVGNVEAVEDFEACEQEKSGSPCTSGGLHMPDSRSLQNFVRHISRIRIHSHHSESGGFSTGTSPQDIPYSINDAKVRRTNSCPEIKKNSPNGACASLTMNRPSKQPVPEEKDEENDEEESTKNVSKLESTCAKISASSQTEEIQPFNFPYEHLFLDVFPPLHPKQSSDHISPTESESSLEEKMPSLYEKVYTPSKVLQKFIDAAIQCHTDKISMNERSGKNFCAPYDAKFLANQLKLMSIQLQLEEHRREIHAERNRRLLGRTRRNKTLEEYNNALKDQVSLLQKELENSSVDLQKIVSEKEAEIQTEQKAAAYWKEKFVELQKEHKKIIDRCQEIEALLKEEKRTNVNNTKVIYECKAALTDVTNELKTCQKEAKAAKELRSTVTECQSEILKAGEMIIRYRCRLSEIMKTNPDTAQHDLVHTAYVEEVEKLKRVLKLQSASLDATKALINHLEKELKDKENHVQELQSSVRLTREQQKKELEELKTKYEELKLLYGREVDRSNDLNYKLSIAKRLNKLSQPMQRNVPEYVNASRFSANTVSGVEENSGPTWDKSNIEADVAHKPLKRHPALVKEDNIDSSNWMTHTMDLTNVCADKVVKLDHESNEESDMISERIRETQTRSRVRKSDASSDYDGESEEFVLQSSSHMSDELDPRSSSALTMVKKKGRMECAETGQFKLTSTRQMDVNQSTSNEKMSQ